MILILLPILVFLGGVNDEEAINLYLRELQTLSEHHIRRDQIKYIEFFYINNENRDPLPKERHKTRHEFESQKRKLKAQWESHYSLKWPNSKVENKETIFNSESGKPGFVDFSKFGSKKIGKRVEICPKFDLALSSNSRSIPVIKEVSYEAHHIIPINAGGINIWWNITPLSPRNHAILHGSIEEKACFSHDFINKAFMRFLLRLQDMFLSIFENIRKGTTKYEQEFPNNTSATSKSFRRNPTTAHNSTPASV